MIPTVNPKMRKREETSLIDKIKHLLRKLVAFYESWSHGFEVTRIASKEMFGELKLDRIFRTLYKEKRRARQVKICCTSQHIPQPASKSLAGMKKDTA